MIRSWMEDKVLVIKFTEATEFLLAMEQARQELVKVNGGKKILIQFEPTGQQGQKK